MAHCRCIVVVLLACSLPNAPAFPRLVPRVDQFGDPLPDRAVVRLGTARFRHPGPLQAVAYSPDGKLVAASSADPPVVRVWERATGALRDEWRFPDAAPPEQLAFGPDGKRLYAGRVPGRSVPWAARDLARRSVVALGPPADEPFTFQTLTPDGRYGVAMDGERVLCCDLAHDRQVASFERPNRNMADVSGPELGWVAISHNRTQYVATRLTDGKELWAVDGDWDAVLPNQPVAFSPDGRRVAVRTEAGRVGVYDTATGKVLARVVGPEDSAVSAMRLGPDGDTLAVSWKGKGTGLYDLPSGKERARLPAGCGSPRDLALSPDAAAVATVDPDGPRTLLFFDAARGTPIDLPAGHTSPVRALAVAPDGSAVACATGPGGEPALTVWDAATGRPRWTVAGGRFADVAFSPDGSSLATASRGLGNRVGLWDARTGRPVRSLDSAGDPVPALAFARDGRLVAGTASRVRAWDGRTGKPVGEPAAVPHGIDRVAVCPDGRRVVVATPGVYICALGKPRAGDPDIPFEKTLTGFALSPDGRLLATADGGPVVRLWEVLTGAEAAAVPFRDPVHGLALGPGGRTLAAATAGGTVLYDLPTAAARLTLRGATADTLVAFSADGRRLATAGSAESTAMVWDVAAVREPPAVRRDPLGRDGLQECWEALAAPDPKLGSAAAWKLAASPAEAVPFLARALGTPLPDAARIARWIADLDHARYAIRERAARALEDAGAQAVDALREARKGKVSAEQAERIDGLLAKLDGPKPAPDRLRASRAVAVLELVGSPAARAVLRDVATGPEAAPRTREAKATLERWK